MQPSLLVAKIRWFLTEMVGPEGLEATLRRRAAMERLFIASTLCDLAGAPIFSSRSLVSLLPFVVPQICTWKRQNLDGFESGIRAGC